MLDGETITRFTSNRVRALLAYLAVEAGRPHSREALATLLWPDWADRAALSNLRYALSDLRQAIGDPRSQVPFLLVTRETIQLNAASSHWIDITEFDRQMQAAGNAHQLNDARTRLASCASLYRGVFLEGFSVADSATFEEWVSFRREQNARQVQSVLYDLAVLHERQGEYGQALAYARRQIELEPWQEEAHQQLMRLLALSGQRSTALAQYGVCRRLLADELGVEPTRETLALYERIRDGSLSPPPAPALPVSALSLPRPLVSIASPDPSLSDRTPFVAREHELARLDAHLGEALAGEGRALFIVGEAGSGKTVLTREFVQRAMDLHPGLVVARGNCSAQTGIGDPYLPFREILAMLSGDVEPRRAGGVLSTEHTRRLWAILPTMARILAREGPDLVGSLIAGAALALRAETYAPGAAWQAELAELVSRQEERIDTLAVSLVQVALFEQTTRVLQALAQQCPLILVVDDLQWADSSSISLLFHLGKSLAGSRILLIGAYRPDDVAIGRSGERHPLEPVVNELQRDLGDITVDLSQAEGREFVDALLNAAPNHLGEAFRHALYQRTGGQALFTVELLRGLQDRGDLVRDQDGCWVVGPALNWETLPVRVEAAIAERIGRLSPECRALLAAASVEGEVFTAEVAARACAADVQATYRRLSGELSDHHHLVRAISLQRLGHQRLSLYRFSHYLYQQYLYNHLDVVERAHLHEVVGNTLEELHAEHLDENTVRLAWHFERAGLAARAVFHLLRAGLHAFRLSANEEAIAHLSHGLALLETMPDSLEHARQELDLHLALIDALAVTRGWGIVERERACGRAYELAQKLQEPARILESHLYLADLYIARGKLHQAIELADSLLGLARRCEDRLSIAAATTIVGICRTILGELAVARDCLTEAAAEYDRAGAFGLESRLMPYFYVRCEATLAVGLWIAGHLDLAAQCEQRVLTIARAQDHCLGLGHALITVAANACLFRQEDEASQGFIDELLHLATAGGLSSYHAWGLILQGWVRSARGESEEGIAQMMRAISDWQRVDTMASRPLQLTLLADACLHAGQTELGVSVVDEALALSEQSELALYQAEMHRLKGELLRRIGDEADTCGETEVCLRQAIRVARKQGARLWELRATISLCRLWQDQGKRDQAHQMLAEICGWFTEEVDIPDLREARTLLRAC
jgi:DNA-binding SARP family transcriptional activator